MISGSDGAEPPLTKVQGVEIKHSNGGPADADRMAGLERDVGQ